MRKKVMGKFYSRLFALVMVCLMLMTNFPARILYGAVTVSAASAQNNTISGTITDADGNPINGVTVTLELGGTTQGTYTTGLDGKYSISDKADTGTYTISASKSGYVTNSADVTIVYTQTAYTKDIKLNLAVTGITVNGPAGVTNYYSGMTYDFTAAFTPANAQSETVVWSVGGGEHGSIDQSGKLTIADEALIGDTIDVTAAVTRAFDGTVITNTKTITVKVSPKEGRDYTIAPAKNSYGWFTDYVTIAPEIGSPNAFNEIWDSVTSNWVNELTVNTQGQHNAEIRLRNSSDLKESDAVTIAVNIDKNNPVISEPTVDPDNSTWKPSKDILFTVTSDNLDEVYWSDKSDAVSGNDITLNSGSGKFTVNANGTYYIYAVDVSGLTAQQSVTVSNIDNTKPVIDGSSIVKTPGSEWANGAATVNIAAPTDTESGLKGIRYGTINDFNSTDNLEAVKADDNHYVFTTPDSEYNGKYYIWAYDNAGNISDVQSIDIKIDKTVPAINSVTFTKSTSDAYEKFIGMVTFGWFYSDVIKVNINGGDAGSGVTAITYYTTGEDGVTGKTEEVTVPGSSAEFYISPDFKGFVFAKAKDAVGNEMTEFIKSVGTVIETKSADEANTSISVESTTPYSRNDFYNGNVNLAYTAVNTYSGISSIKYSINSGTEIALFNAGENEFTTTKSGTIDVDSSIYNGNDVTVAVTVMDNSGNTKTEEKILKIDTSKPTIGVSYDDNNAVNGNYYKDNRTAAITIDELNFDPADVNLTINKDGVPQDSMKPATWTTDGTKHIANILFDADGAYALDISYTDLAGNAGNTVAAQSFTIDKTAPIVAVQYDNNDAGNGNCYKAGRTAAITIKDANLNESSINVTVNNTVTSVQWTKQDNLYTAAVSFSEDGKYNLKVACTDMAGNNSTPPVDENFIIDTKAPAISTSDISFTKKGVDAFERLMNFITFGQFFNEEIQVQINASDATSGVASITYYALMEDGVTKKVQDTTVEGSSATFYITPDFKGFVFAKAKDAAGNEMAEFTKSVGTVVEGKTSADNNTKLSLKSITQQNENGLYKGDVVVNFNVMNNYSGINNVKYTVSPGKPQETTIFTTNINEFKSTWDGTITVQAASNDSNDVIANIIVEDNSGNIKSFPINMKIDVTAPKINVSYDNNDAVNVNYYKANRTATITIDELNFNSEDVNITMKKDGVVQDTVPISTWQRNGSINTATILFDKDGAYTFDISYTDMAGNAGNAVETQNFIIDKTAPIVSVQYDNNNVQNGRYYKADRTATITIDEVNFNTLDANILINNTAVDTTGLTWVKDGSKNTTSIPFNTDGDYTLDIKYIDMAGNSADTFTPQNFVIDKTAPKISVVYDNNDAQHGNNYSRKRTATITIEEMNFRASDVDLTVKKNDTVLNTFQSVIWSSNGITHTAVIEYRDDGDYEFSISYVDLAGNSGNSIGAQNFIVDNTAPVINTDDIIIKQQNEGAFYKFIDFITFKHFLNDDISVSIKASDDTSNIISITYYAIDEKLGKVAERTIDFAGSSKEEQTSFTISPNFKGFVYAKAKNAAGIEMPTYTKSQGAISENKSNPGDFHVIGINPQENPNIHGLYNKDVFVDLSAGDSYAGLSSVTYTIGKNGQPQTFVVQKTEDGELNPSWNRTVKVAAAENNSNTVDITVTAVDNSGNEFTKTQTLAIDVTAPKINMTYDNNSAANGKYYKDSRTAKISIDELNFIASDVNIIVKKDGVVQNNMKPSPDSWQTDGNLHTANILFDADGEYTFDISYTDAAGNAGNAIDTQNFIIDKTHPVINVSYDNNNVANGKYYRGNRVATISIDEKNFNAADVDITVKKDGEVQENKRPSTGSWQGQGITNIVTIPYDVDGEYTFDISYTDMAGNAGNVIQTHDFVIDKTQAEIKSSDITFAKKNTGAFERLMNFITFKTFFNEETSVNIKAKDDISGIASITYYKTEKDGVTRVGNEETVTYNGFESERNVSFSLAPDFKGFIFARAKNASGIEMAQFTQSVGVIVEDKNASGSLPVIEITPKTQPNANGFYKGDVKVDLKVTDTYSGINNIKYTIGSGAQQTYTAPNSDKDELTPSWSQEVTVPASANNNNNVVITITAEDNSGNVTSKSMPLKIDVTAPKIDVKYDNNNAVNVKYYKANRTAAITIDELNFNPADVNITVRKNGVTQGNMKPSVSAWHRIGNINTAAIAYDTDGDYTFDISYTDMAGNAGNYVPTQSFVIDKTLPVIAVSYDNNSVQNGNYYKANRTATITITEVNFKAEDVKVSVTAANNGSAVQVPGVGRWTDGADNKHTAAISFTADARYTLDIAYSDLASNNAPAFATQTFFVDKTNPSLSITGVKDLSANRNPISPVISYSDTNIDIGRVQITLKGSNTGSAVVKGQKSENANGGSLKFDELQVDDNYALTTVVYDKAGNSTTLAVSFSVNKNGATYSFEQKGTVEDKYVNQPFRPSIKISDVDEVNIVSLTLNGKNVEYTFENGVITFKDEIKEDGKYVIAIVAKDAAGNTTSMKDVEFVFDGTKPKVAVSGAENGGIYFDTIKLNIIPEKADDVFKTIRLNNKELGESDYTRNSDGSITLTLSEFQNYKLQVQTADKAGNLSDMTEIKFQITNNLFIKIYETKPVFYGIVSGFSVIVLGVICFFMFFKKKDKTTAR